MQVSSWARSAGAVVTAVAAVSFQRVSAMALVGAAACGASESPQALNDHADASEERLGSLQARLSTFTEDFEAARLGGPWPLQWSAQSSGASLAFTTTNPFSTTAQLGRVNGPPGGSTNHFLLGVAPRIDSDQSVNVALGQNTIHSSLYARRLATDTYYGCLVGQNLSVDRLRFFKATPANGYQELALAGTSPSAGVPVIASFNTWYRLRFKVTQDNSTTPPSTKLQAKLWQGGAEPAGWTLELVDSEPLLQNQPGYNGVGAADGTAPSKFAYFDDYQLDNVPNSNVCDSDTTCESGRYCSQAGECRMPGNSCSTSAQCAQGQTCRDSACVCPSPPNGCQAPGGPAPTLATLMASVPPLEYRPVTYARDIADYVLLPTPTPDTTPPVSPTLQRANHFIMNVGATQAVTLSVAATGTSAAPNALADLAAYNASGIFIRRAIIDSSVPGPLPNTIELGTLTPGNYEFDIVPRSPGLKYTVAATSPSVTLAFKGGADLTETGSATYFFVPAEVEAALLAGQFDSGSPVPQFFAPDGQPVAPTQVNPTTFAFSTRGKPGVWRTSFRTSSSRAHLINLPDVFSFSAQAVVASKRIRTEMAPSSGASVAITSPTLRYNNRFAFRVTSASAPVFTIGNGSSIASPPPIIVRMLDASGADVVTASGSSPFSITPNGTPQSVSASLQPGDYELHIANPSIYTAYSIGVPPGVPFVSVDGYGLGSNFSASARAYFTVPPGTPSVRFAAKPVSVPIEIYDANGSYVGQPTLLGNSVYEIADTTAGGTWAINLKGDYWTDIRLLNVPQVIAFHKELLQPVALGGPTFCSVNAHCPSGQACESGQCVCGSSTACSPSCRCGSGGTCANAADCALGFSCQAGTCQSCGNSSCPGGPCTTGSDCAPGLICAAGQCGESCAEHPTAPDCVESTCDNGVQDGAETDVDCGGGGCEPCTKGDVCTSSADCGSGLECGVNNGGYFGQTRSTRVCWPVACEDGVEATECGDVDALCGPNCGGVVTCTPDDPHAQCPAGETCKHGLGQMFGSPAEDVCVNNECPSDDPTLCGTVSSLCGEQCVCEPDCSTATAASPADGCDGVCPHLCQDGQACCTSDLNCAIGSSCQLEANGAGICRKDICAFARLAPPLCGHVGAICGDQCPACIPECDGRQCGLDPKCGLSCGTCGNGNFCGGDGQCRPSAISDAPLQAKDGQGNPVDVTPLPLAAATPVGAIAGEFSVSELGSAHYSIPIAVPPGRGGMEPGLSLSYVSSKASTEAGVGWKLEGLSKISRCPKSFALDGHPSPVRNDEADRFCIDGKRLETVAGSATYGADGAEYRTLIDSFAKVISYQEGEGFQLDSAIPRVDRPKQGPDYFKVWMKDGRILTYGRTRDSLVMLPNGVRATWLLNRVEDRAHNTMLVTYSNLGAAVPRALAEAFPNIVRPLSIFYTGHNDVAGDREVRFTYAPRDDQRLTFLQGGTPMFMNERLSRITTFVRATPVKNYRLEYKEGSLSQLEAVKECAGDSEDVCKLPTTFEYETETGFTQTEVPGPSIAGASQLDVNGDGLPDFMVTTATSNGIPPDDTLAAVYVGGDIAAAAGGTAASIYLTPLAGIAVEAVWAVSKEIINGLLGKKPTYSYSRELYVGTGNRLGPPVYISPVNGIPCNRGPSFFVDYDQDGKDDVVDVCQLSNVRVARSLGSGQFSASRVLELDFNRDVLFSLPPPILYDVDGDALQDLVRCRSVSELQVYRRLAPDVGFATTPIVLKGAFGDDDAHLPFCGNKVPTYQILDLDGDGTPELLTRLMHSGSLGDAAKFGWRGPGWYALRFSIVASAAKVDFERVFFPDLGTSSLAQGMMLTDVNGDGLKDVWQTLPDNEVVFAWLNTGKGFMPKALARPRVARDFEPRARLWNAAPLDFNADGQLDFLEHWVKFSGGSFSLELYDKYNVLVRPNGRIDSAETTLQEYPRLVLPFNQGVTAAPFTNVGDIDGDGNEDLFGVGGWTFYGSGSRNLLLKKVKDGLGRFVHVRYDHQTPYHNECGPGQQWPEKCLPIVRGLVSDYREGFVDGNGNETAERAYRYDYFNARVSVTGHGWLGFDKRIVVETVQNQRRSITTEFQPIARYTLDGLPTTGTAPPYLYPLAGLARKVTLDEGLGSAAFLESTLEDQPNTRRTITTNTWDVAASGADRPYPRLEYRSTDSYSRPYGTALEPTPPTDNGEFRFGCNETFSEFDPYGSPRDYTQKCHHGESIVFDNSTTTAFQSNAVTWFVSQPTYVTETSKRDGVTHERVTDLVYENELLQEVVRDPAAENQRTRYWRDSYGNVEIVVESVAPSLVNGVSLPETPRTTTIVYDDAKLFPRRITQTVSGSVALITQLEIEPRFGGVATIVDPNGVVSQNRYDELGRLVEEHGPDGVTTYSYAALPGNSIQTAIGPIYPRVQVAITPSWKHIPNGTASPALVQELDSYGRMVRSTNEGFAGANVIAERTYDARGRLFRASRPHLPSSPVKPHVTYTYDYLDRLVSVENSDGSFSTHEYGSRVSLASEYLDWVEGVTCPSIPGDVCAVDVELVTATRYANEEPKQSVIVRDLSGNILRTIDGENVGPGGASSNFEYGPFNELVQLRDNDDNVTVFTRDDYGRLRYHVDPDSGLAAYTYNGFSEVKTRTDPDHSQSIYTYDAIGRVKELVVGSDTTRWEYDAGPGALGRLSSSISPSTPENASGQQVAYGYDERTGLPASSTYTIDGQVYTIGLHYDDFLRLNRIDYPTSGGGSLVQASLGYDPASGALNSVRQGVDSTSRPIWHVDSAFEGQLPEQVTFGNGAVSTFGYDADRRWLKSARTSIGGDTIQDLEYMRYGNGQVHERITPTKTREYAYDAVGRLSSLLTTGFSAREYRYDTAGNVTQRGLTDNAYSLTYRHQLESVGSVTYYYEYGRVTSRVGPAVPGGAQTIAYTPFDLPRTIRTGTGSAERVTTFDYTADAQRVVRRDPEGARHFASNLYQRLLSPSGATIEERFRIPAGGSMVAEIVRQPGSADRTLYFHDDHLGTPDTISDSDEEFTRQEYGPFGEPVDDPPDVNDDLTRRGFTGHQQDNDLGLIDMSGRIYDPLAGRFMTPDPIMQAPFSSQGQNRYSYVFNDPINLTDPSGFVSSGEVVTAGVFSVGYGIVSYGIATEMAKVVGRIGGGAALGAAGSIAGGSINVARSIAMTRGTPGGGKAIAPSPSGAPSSESASWATVQEGGAPDGSRALEQLDRNGEYSDPADADNGGNYLAQRMPPRRPRGAPVPGGGGPVLRAVPRAMHGPLLINAQQQAGHIRGTPQYLNRIKQGTPTSTFLNPTTADALTIRAWQVGQPVGIQGNLRVLEFGRPVGVGPHGGGYQTQIRASMDIYGRVHGTPYGPVYAGPLPP